MPMEPLRTVTITQQMGAISVGRSHDDQPLLLVLPQEQVRTLAQLLHLARARIAGNPPGTGSDAVLALMNALAGVVSKYEAAVSVDTLTVRSSASQKEALAELERIARELDKL